MPTSLPKLLDENPCETSHPPRDYIDSLAVTAVGPAWLDRRRLCTRVVSCAPRAWQSAGIVGLAACGIVGTQAPADPTFDAHTLWCMHDRSPHGLEMSVALRVNCIANCPNCDDKAPRCRSSRFEIDDFETHSGTRRQACRQVGHPRSSADRCNSLREFDVLARVEGIRFTAILPTTRLIDAEAIAERIRVSGRGSSSIGTRDCKGSHVSIGIAAAVTLDTEDSVRARVHASLRNAQRLGPNRCCSQSHASGTGSAHRPGKLRTEPTQFLMLRRPSAKAQASADTSPRSSIIAANARSSGCADAWRAR